MKVLPGFLLLPRVKKGEKQKVKEKLFSTREPVLAGSGIL
jgi:hypothetical protein